MKNSILKKSLSLLIITVLCFNSAGYLFVHLQLRFIFKKIARNKIENNSIIDKVEVIKVSKKTEANSIIFVEKNEIKFNGKMFDVLKVEENKDEIFFYCISDENEDNLSKVFEKQIANCADKNSDGQLPFNILKILNYDSIEPFYFNLKYNSFQNSLIPELLGAFTNFKAEISTPPPKS